MARTQSFDRDTVVAAARTLFWTTGYENASIADLEGATGLRRSSLYNTFGSKRGLFDATIQSYLAEIIRPRLRPLTLDVVAPDALPTYLVGLRDAFGAPSSLPARNGCLLINAAGGPIGHDERVRAVIADYASELQRALTRGVRAATIGLDPAAATVLGETITGLVVAGFAVVRVDPVQAVRNVELALTLLAERADPAVYPTPRPRATPE